jgi:hypothetical protein
MSPLILPAAHNDAQVDDADRSSQPGHSQLRYDCGVVVLSSRSTLRPGTQVSRNSLALRITRYIYFFLSFSRR